MFVHKKVKNKNAILAFVIFNLIKKIYKYQVIAIKVLKLIF